MTPCHCKCCPLPALHADRCQYHAAAHDVDWVGISQALRECIALVNEIDRARTAFAAPASADIDLVGGHVAALERLRSALTAEQLTFLQEQGATNYPRFVYQLEMLVGRAVQRVCTRRRSESTDPVPSHHH